MQYRRTPQRYTVFLLLITTFSFTITYVWFAVVYPNLAAQPFAVHFLNVGQGDATLITTPRGRTILIDGGRGPAVMEQLGTVLPPYENDIDVVIATHPDADHIGGFIPVLEQYNVRYIIQNNTTAETSVYTILQERIQAEGATVHTMDTPVTFTLDDVVFSLLWPSEENITNTNASSIVLTAIYKEAEVLLTGDAPRVVEERLVEIFPDLLTDIDVLKAGHHGSRTSTSQTLNRKDNPYIRCHLCK